MNDVITVDGTALSDRDGVVSMSYSDQYASNQGQGSLVNLENLHTSLRLEVPTHRLDTWVRQRDLARIDLIKLDVQGAEPMVLAGAQETIERFAPDLLVEVSPEDLRSCGLDSTRLCSTIETAGYALYELRRGRIHRRIRAEGIAPYYEASNVYCTKRPRGA
jgi:FkbM family methyltransferase